MDRDDFFPYFAIIVGAIAVGIAAYSPQGKGQDTALTMGASLASGGLTAYGMRQKYQGGNDETRQ